MRHKIIPVFIPHASCPNQCIFCNQKEITRVVGYDLDSVSATLSGLVGSLRCISYAKREIAFYGGSFTAIESEYQESLLALAKRYIDNGQIDSIRVSTRPDYINEDILSRLHRYGVRTIELGVQSMSDHVLDANRRGHTRQDTIDASKLIRERGFMLGHQIMPGLLDDTRETILKTAAESICLKPDFLRVYPCLVVKDTKLYELFKAGEYAPMTIDEAVSICKSIFLMAQAGGVKIIRMGLHPERDFVDDGFVAGPFHPAFKQLVVSSLFCDISEMLIERSATKGEAKFIVNPKDISNFVGIRGANVKRLKEKYSLSNIEFTAESNLKQGSIAIDNSGTLFKADLSEAPLNICQA